MRLGAWYQKIGVFWYKILQDCEKIDHNVGFQEKRQTFSSKITEKGDPNIDPWFNFTYVYKICYFYSFLLHFFIEMWAIAMAVWSSGHCLMQCINEEQEIMGSYAHKVHTLQYCYFHASICLVILLIEENKSEVEK
jgi:hypothetical protein